MDAWNWDAIGAIGSLLGALAVGASVYYLASQIRYSALATRAQTASSAVASIRQFNEAMVSNPDAERVFRLGVEGLSDLDEADRAKFAHLAFDFLKTAEELHFQFLHGTLDADVWESWRTLYATYATGPGFRVWWASRSRFFTSAFREEYASWKDTGVESLHQFAARSGGDRE
jgi:hypothetical protein